MNGKFLRKTIQQLLLMIFISKKWKWKYVQLIIQNITQTKKNKLPFQ